MPDAALSGLRSRRVLITRTRAQASALAAELLQQGATPLLIPAIAIVPPSSFAPLNHALATLSRFSWVIVTSTNAVDAIAARAQLLGVTLHPQRLAAIGKATAEALRAAGIVPELPPVLLPAVAVAESLADALLPHINDLRRAAPPASVALLRAASARDTLPQALADAGAEVSIIPAYETVIPASSIDALRHAFSRPGLMPDAITFTSSSTVTHLLAMLKAANLPLPAGILRISIGPVTSATLRGLGLPPDAEAAEPTIPAMIDALECAFRITRNPVL